MYLKKVNRIIKKKIKWNKYQRKMRKVQLAKNIKSGVKNKWHNYLFSNKIQDQDLYFKVCIDKKLEPKMFS